MTYSEVLDVLQRALQSERPVLIVVAGSNGAGKTTFYELYLEHLGLPFVNTDNIAQLLLDSSHPAQVAYQAANLADHTRRDLIQRRLSFCMETVFSDPVGDKVGFLKDAQTGGYTVAGIFITLSDPALSMARVAQRVDRGGHDVPDGKLQSGSTANCAPRLTKMPTRVHRGHNCARLGPAAQLP
ncbi:MAG TPA: zeta toxin family protein [Steroidobacteraceae bacterium]